MSTILNEGNESMVKTRRKSKTARDKFKSELRRKFASFVEEARLEFAELTEGGCDWELQSEHFRDRVWGAAKILEAMNVGIDISLVCEWLFSSDDPLLVLNFRKSSDMRMAGIFRDSIIWRCKNDGRMSQYTQKADPK